MFLGEGLDLGHERFVFLCVDFLILMTHPSSFSSMEEGFGRDVDDDDMYKVCNIYS